jgi:hypothetical protein
MDLKYLKHNEADEFVKEAAIRWTGLKKRNKLPGHITIGNTMICVERNNVSVQTDSNFNTLDTELAEKEQHVMELMKQAAKILRLPMDDFDNDIFKDSDCLFGIFKLFLLIYQCFVCNVITHECIY